MAIISRSMPEWAKSNSGRFTRYLITRAISFDETPCTLAEANAHLTMLAPHGIVVLASRGLRGGWSGSGYTHDLITEGLAMRRTLHIGYLANTSKVDIYG